jgi:hypothetical protein
MMACLSLLISHNDIACSLGRATKSDYVAATPNEKTFKATKHVLMAICFVIMVSLKLFLSTILMQLMTHNDFLKASHKCYYRLF